MTLDDPKKLRDRAEQLIQMMYENDKSEYVNLNGDKIKFTQSALNIEDLIGKLMYSLTSK